MFSSINAPYLVPDKSMIHASPWLFDFEQSEMVLPTYLEAWTPGSDITLYREIEIDRDRILDSSGLPKDAELAISVSWRGEKTKIVRPLFRRSIGENKMLVPIRINGQEANGKITVITNLILNRELEEVPSWVARSVGSVLMNESVSVYLDLKGAEFPLAVVDFANLPVPLAASWFLELPGDFDAKFSSSCQVLVNERDKRLTSSIEATTPNKEEQVILDNFIGGVISQLTEIAYRFWKQGDLELDGNEEGSTAAFLSNLIQRTGPVDIDFGGDVTSIAFSQATFEGLAREMEAGRSFS